MNVASLELCKKLYELSGWNTTDFVYVNRPRGNSDRWDVRRRTPRTTSNHSLIEHISAYDLGYLLRKLPKGTTITKFSGKLEGTSRYYANVTTNLATGEVVGSGNCNTPEDAACKLCTELIKQGVLALKDSEAPDE